MQTHAGNGRT